MLVLSRQVDEKIFIGNEITIQVVRIDGHIVRIGIEAPKHMPIYRPENAHHFVGGNNKSLAGSHAQ